MTYIGDVPHGDLVVPVMFQVTPVHVQIDYPASKHSDMRQAFSSSLQILNWCFSEARSKAASYAPMWTRGHLISCPTYSGWRLEPHLGRPLA